MVVIFPHMSIVEDQVKYLRSLGIQATYIGESKTIARQIFNGDGGVFFVVRKPVISNWGQEIQDNVVSGVLSEEHCCCCLCCDEGHTFCDKVHTLVRTLICLRGGVLQ